MSDLQIYRGEGKTWTGTATVNGAPLNLTGAVIYLTVYTEQPSSSTVSDAGATIHKSSATPGEIEITNGPGGVFEFTFEKPDTNLLPVGVYFFGIEALLFGATSPVVLDQRLLQIMTDPVRAQ